MSSPEVCGPARGLTFELSRTRRLAGDCRLQRKVSQHHSTRKLYHKGKSILHGRPAQTAGLNLVSSKTVLANLVIPELGEPIALTCATSPLGLTVAMRNNSPVTRSLACIFRMVA